MNEFCQKFNLTYPIIQAGMVWCSGWQLAAASANSGILGVIGSGSMYPEILDEQLRKCKDATTKEIAVNVPLLYPQIEDHFEVILKHGIKTIITSAGNPAKYTAMLKQEGVKVIQVVSSSRFARKAEEAGVDAVVAEGFEAGGHNGREETTTLCLVPLVKREVGIPVIAAGGIASGRSMFAAMALGADGVQIGTRFVASLESSAHPNFKEKVLNTKEGDTVLTLKELAPVRLIRNRFFQQIEEAYMRGAKLEELRRILGRGRAKRGMFEGDMDEGELEIGQVSAFLNDLKPVEEIVEEIILEYEKTRLRMSKQKLKS